MKTISLRLLAALALAPLAFAGLEENLPATTYGLIKVENIAKTTARLEAHPAAKSAGAAKMKAFFAPGLAKARETDAKSFAEFEKIRELAEKHLRGEFVFAVVRTPAPLPGHHPYDLVTLADTDADEAAIAGFLKEAKLLQPSVDAPEAGQAAPADDKAKPMSDEDEEAEEDEAAPQPVAGARKPKIELPKLEAVEEEFAGVKLHLLTVKQDDKTVGVGGWALVDKTFIHATAPNVLKELVEARKSGRKDSFADSAIYKANKDSLSDRDLWLLLNLPLIADTAREHLVAKRDEAQKNGKPAPGGGVFDPIKTFDAMAFDNLTHLRIAAAFNPDDTRFESALGWREFKGVVTLLQYKSDLKPETSLAPADAISVDAVRFDVSASLAVLEGMIRDAFPFAAPMLDVQLDKMKNDEGLDIRSAILANFGDSIVTVTGEAAADAGAPDAMPQVWIVSLNDANKLASFIETALGKVAASQTGDGKKAVFDEREILGIKVRDFKTGAGAPRFAYALHKNRLLISKGDPVLLNKVIGQLVDPRPGIDSTPGHLAALKRLPEGGAGISHADLDRLLGTICRLLITTVETKPLTREKSADVFDRSQIPVTGDFPFLVVGKAYATPTGIETKAVLVPKSGEESK